MLFGYFMGFGCRNPGDIILLEDGMSPVADYEAEGDAFFAYVTSAGEWMGWVQRRCMGGTRGGYGDASDPHVTPSHTLNLTPSHPISPLPHSTFIPCVLLLHPFITQTRLSRSCTWVPTWCRLFPTSEG